MKTTKNTEEIVLTDDHSEKKIIWYPGHMIKAMNKIKEHLKAVDIVLEVRDARSPLISGNKDLKEQIGGKNLLIVINKANLADPEMVERWKEWFTKQEEPFVFVNCFDEDSLRQVVGKAKQVINNRKQKENKDYKPKTKLKMMVVGLPNTGKSTIINRLSGRNATKVADKPGQTRQQLWVKASDDMQILDNPGVMPPVINNYEEGLWLAVIHAIPEKIVTSEETASYVINYLLQTRSEIFKEHYKMETLDTDLLGAMDQIAKSRGFLKKGNLFDYDRVYKIILFDFRKGDLGKISFGLPPE